MELFVKNLSYGTDEATLTQAFQQFGEVRRATVIKDRDTGQSRGFGFVEMPDADAQRAMAALDGQSIDGRRVFVSESRSQGRPPRPGGPPPRHYSAGGDRPPSGAGRGPGPPPHAARSYGGLPGSTPASAPATRPASAAPSARAPGHNTDYTPLPPQRDYDFGRGSDDDFDRLAPRRTSPSTADEEPVRRRRAKHTNPHSKKRKRRKGGGFDDGAPMKAGKGKASRGRSRGFDDDEEDLSAYLDR